MGSITIPNFEEVLERCLRGLADSHGHFVEETRDILDAAPNR